MRLSGEQFQRDCSLQFTQEDGQWRISVTNPGIVLERLRFNQVFSSHALYFYDPTYTYLVPDLRWFSKAETTSTRIVKALLAGPSPWLGQGAVVTAFPDGTEAAPVVVSSGRAQVNLSSQVLQNAQALQRMQYQLEKSLGTVASVASVQITVNQNAVSIPPGSASQPITDPRVDSRPLVFENGQFGYLSGGSVVPIPEMSNKVQGLSPLSATLSVSAKVTAVGTAAGVYALQSGTNEPVLVDSRPGLVPPSLDPTGYIWTVPAELPNQVQVYGPTGNFYQVPANWDGATGIRSLDVSRDGTRILAFTVADGLPRLIVAAIIRDKDGAPVRVGDPVSLESGPGVPVDASWVNQLNVASLTVLPAGANSIVLQEIGGRSSSLGVPTAATSMVGGNDLDGLRLLTTTGGLQQRRGSGWQTTTEGIAFLGTQI
jgi:hypothetical protein